MKRKEYWEEISNFLLKSIPHFLLNKRERKQLLLIKHGNTRNILNETLLILMIFPFFLH